MKESEKRKLLDNFDVLTEKQKDILVKKHWKFIPQYDDYTFRHSITNKAKLIDSATYQVCDSDYGYQSDIYKLMTLDGKYYLEDENYYEGGGTDHWCWCFNMK